MRETNLSVIAIPEGTALHISDSKYHVIGEKPLYIFENDSVRKYPD